MSVALKNQAVWWCRVTTVRSTYGCHGVGVERGHRTLRQHKVGSSMMMVLKPEVLPRGPSCSLSISSVLLSDTSSSVVLELLRLGYLSIRSDPPSSVRDLCLPLSRPVAMCLVLLPHGNCAVHAKHMRTKVVPGYRCTLVQPHSRDCPGCHMAILAAGCYMSSPGRLCVHVEKPVTMQTVMITPALKMTRSKAALTELSTICISVSRAEPEESSKETKDSSIEHSAILKGERKCRQKVR